MTAYPPLLAAPSASSQIIQHYNPRKIKDAHLVLCSFTILLTSRAFLTSCGQNE